MDKRTESRNLISIKGIVIASSMAVLALIGGSIGTYALFNHTTTASTHIKVGNLKLEFERNKLVSHTIGDEGLMIDVEDNTVVDLTTSGSEAMGIEYAAPGCYYVGTFALTNTGRVAFTARMDFINFSASRLDGEDITVEEENELKQFTFVTVNDDATSTQNFENALVSYTFSNEVVKVNDTLEFTIKIALDEQMSNPAQDLQFSFDLRLICIQYVN